MDSYKKIPLRYFGDMQLPKSTAVFSDLYWFEEIDSTNKELERLIGPSTKDFTAVISASQTQGQGRLGRSWQSPKGSSLSLSVLIEKAWISEPGWLSLLAALAVTRTVRSLGASTAGIKWPNDILVDGKKLCGILSQLFPSGSAIVGIGVNLNSNASELETATSLQELGIEIEIDSLAALIGANLKELVSDFRANPDRVKAEFSSSCLTLGQQVRAELPGGSDLLGLASAVDPSGQLVILTPEPHHLSAADVWHLRS